MSDFEITIKRIAEKNRVFFYGNPTDYAEVLVHDKSPIVATNGVRIGQCVLVFEFTLEQDGGLNVVCAPYYTPKHLLDGLTVGNRKSSGTRLEHYSLIGIRYAMGIERDKARSIIGQFGT